MVPRLARTPFPPDGVATRSRFDPIPSASISEAGTDPLPIASGGCWLYGANSTTLYRARRVGGAWTNLGALPSSGSILDIKAAGDGEMLVSRGTAGIWKSSGWAANPATATWTQALNTGGGTVRRFSWDVDPDSGWVSVTTYDGVPNMDLSRYVWLSTNHGNSFTEVFDMAEREPGLDQDFAHMHLAAIDPATSPPRVWISFHKTSADPTWAADKLSRILTSDDAGVTWDTYSAEYFQPVTANAIPLGMVFGGDEALIGTYLAPSGGSGIEYLQTFPEDDYFGFASASCVASDGVVYIAYRSTVVNKAARIVATDGERAVEVAAIAPATSSDAVDVTNLVEHQGRLVAVHYQTVSGAGVPLLWTADIPRLASSPYVEGCARFESGVLMAKR